MNHGIMSMQSFFCNTVYYYNIPITSLSPYPYSHIPSSLQQHQLHTGLYKPRHATFNFSPHGTNHHSFPDRQLHHNRNLRTWRHAWGLAISIEPNNCNWSRNAPYNITPSKSAVSYLLVSEEFWLFLTHCKLSPLIRLSVSLPLFVPHPGWRGCNCRVTCTCYTLRHERVCAGAHARTHTRTPICKHTSVLSDRHC